MKRDAKLSIRIESRLKKALERMAAQAGANVTVSDVTNGIITIAVNKKGGGKK